MLSHLRRIVAWFGQPKVAPYLFISPFFVLFGVFMLWPIISSLIMSSFQYQGLVSRTFVGFDNYSRLSRDPRFLYSLFNTLLFAGTMLVLSITTGIGFSLVLNSEQTPARNLFRLTYFAPILTSVVVAGAVFKLILVDTNAGLLNWMVGLIGIPPQRWLLDSRFAIFAVIGLGFWRRFGLNIVYFLAGLQGVPDDLYESAIIDGANRLQQTFYITIPLLKPIIAFVSTITLIYSFQAFTEVFVLNPAGAMDSAQSHMVILGYYLYESAFTFFRLGYGSAIGVILTLVVLGVAVVQLKALGAFRDE